jgi:hypothetical protein
MSKQSRDSIDSLLTEQVERHPDAIAVLAANRRPLTYAGCRAHECDFYLADLRASAVLVQHAVESPLRDVARARGIPVIEVLPCRAAAPVSAGCAATNAINGLLVARDKGWPVIVLADRRSWSQKFDVVPIVSYVTQQAVNRCEFKSLRLPRSRLVPRNNYAH